VSDTEFPRPAITKREYDTPAFWSNYLTHFGEIIPDRETRGQLAALMDSQYECGNYGKTLESLKHLFSSQPRSIEALWPYVKFCERVVSIPVNMADAEYERKYERWIGARTLLPTWLFKRLFKSRPPYTRCKYCARFVPFQDPNEGFAYLGGNKCERCHRSYPMPSLQWDSVGGQAYMFYRRSVNDEAFYQTAATQFDILDRNDESFGGAKPPGL
jgi:hypothetical protein